MKKQQNGADKLGLENTMALRIAPCPFCGSQNLHLVVHGLTHSISCMTCRCRGPQKANQDAAILYWNNTRESEWTQEHQLPSCQADELRKPNNPNLDLPRVVERRSN